MDHLRYHVRGGRAVPNVLASIEQMTEETAREWLVLLRNAEEDGRADRRRP